jgi:phosphohistidine phosphatase
MKRIYLVRHAQAASKKSGRSDFDRRLTKKGTKEAYRMAKRLKDRGVRPDILISSPANRALETAAVFAEVLGYPPLKVKIRKDLYPDPNDDALFGVIRDTDPRLEALMIVGHDPSLSRLGSSLDVHFNEALPKAGVAAFSFESSGWSEVGAGRAGLEFFEVPEARARARKAYRNELSEDLRAAINDVLNKKDPHSAHVIRKDIQKAAAKLAEGFVKSLAAIPVQTPAPGARERMVRPEPTAKKAKPASDPRAD